MIKVRAVAEDGTPVYVLGLSEQNIALLREGKPIKFDMSDLGAGPGRMVIAWGETDEAMEADFSEMLMVPIGPERAG